MVVVVIIKIKYSSKVEVIVVIYDYILNAVPAFASIRVIIVSESIITILNYYNSHSSLHRV